MKDFLPLIDLKAVVLDKQAAKKHIPKINDPRELYEALAGCLKLTAPIDAKYFVLCSRSPPLRTLSKSIVSVLTRCVVRFFCHFTYQFPKILSQAMAGDSVALGWVRDIPCVLIFFTQLSGDDVFRSFLMILERITDAFAAQWEAIMGSTKNSALLHICLDLLVHFVSVVQAGSARRFPTSFISGQLFKVFGLISEERFPLDMAMQIRSSISLFLTVSQAMSDNDRKNLTCIANHIMNNFVGFALLPPSEILQIGAMSMRIYSQCPPPVSERMTNVQFESICRFIVWVTSQFETGFVPIQGVKQPAKAELSHFTQSIRPVAYLNAYPEMPKLPQFEFHQQLTTLIPIFVAVCENYKLTLRLLVETLEDKQNQLPPDQFQVYRAVVIHMLATSNPATIGTAFFGDWVILFPGFVYPKNPFEMEDTLLRDALNCVVYNLFKSLGDSRLAILDGIAKALASPGDQPYHVLLLFVQFLRDNLSVPSQNLLSRSQFFPMILTIAKTDIIWFDYVRVSMYRTPEQWFGNSDYWPYFVDFFFDEDRWSSIVTCFAAGMTLTSEERIQRESQRNVISGVVSIARKCLENELEIVTELFPVIESSAASFTEKVAQLACGLGLVSIIADIAATLNSIFPRCVTLLSTISQQNDGILQYLIKDETTFYSKLEEGTIKGEPSLEKGKAILELATIFRLSKGAPSLIRNYRAIELLLINAACSYEGEVWITSELKKLASISRNLPEFGNGKVVQMIINRILEIQSDQELRQTYISLLKLISEHVFTIATFQQISDVIRSPTFQFPNELLQLVVDLFAATLPSTRATYFQFDGRESGLFANPMPVGESFVVCFSIRLESPVALTVQQPLLTLVGLETVYLHLKEGMLGCIKKDLDGYYPIHFLPETWYFMAVSVTPWAVSVTVNMGPVFSVGGAFRLGNDVAIYVASKAPDRGVRSLVGEVSPVFVFKAVDMKLLKSRITPSTLPPQLSSQLICCFNPNVSHRGSVVQNFKVRGHCVCFISTIHDVLPTKKGIISLISMFEKPRNDPNLDVRRGQDFLAMLIRLLQKVLLASDVVEPLFEGLFGFRVLASLLWQIESRFFGSALPEGLVHLFEAVTSPSLKTEMFQHI
jgi:hypothetical protein